MRLARFAPLVLLLSFALPSAAQQTDNSTYSRRNTFATFFEYSNDSSHIILGDAENRKIGAIGFQYQRRLLHRNLLDFSYTAEVRPGMIESDPTETITTQETSPTQGTFVQGPMPVTQCRAHTTPYSFDIIYTTGPILQSGTVIIACGRRTVVEQGFSPVGLRLNLMLHHRLQPTFSTSAGYMFATQQVPVTDAGSFNFTFEFGGGLEYYLTHTRSIRLEYQVQHYSNKKTADLNPGVDSGFFKLTYTFGR
jgi:hypothetical protein